MKRLMLALLCAQQCIWAGLDEGIAYFQLIMLRIKQNDRSESSSILDRRSEPDPNYQQAFKNYATLQDQESEEARQPEPPKKKSWWIFGCGTRIH